MACLGGRQRGADEGSSDEESAALLAMCKAPPLSKCAQDLLVVFDMDHTMVGDLVSLSDRDNVETNMPWAWWPERTERGLGPATITQYLQRGMLRPGLPELLSHLRMVGATIVVYTHSEDRWAVKVCQALERCAGWPFIHRVYSRMDCRDGHREFAARKSLQYIVQDLKEQDALDWVEVGKTIMFDDDAAALSPQEADRLVTVASYDHWEPCPWDENVNEAMLAKNPENLAQVLRASVVDWGIAPPSYARMRTGETCEVTPEDLKWASKMQKKEKALLAFNQVARADRVMYDILDAMSDISDLKALPDKVRHHLRQLPQPRSRRVSRAAAHSSSGVGTASSPGANSASSAASVVSSSSEGGSRSHDSASLASLGSPEAAGRPHPTARMDDVPLKKGGRGPLPMPTQEAGACGPAPGPEEPPSGGPVRRDSHVASNQSLSRQSRHTARDPARCPSPPDCQARRSTSPLSLRAKVRESRSQQGTHVQSPSTAARSTSPANGRLSPVSRARQSSRLAPASASAADPLRRVSRAAACALPGGDAAQEASAEQRAAHRRAAEAKFERVDRLLGQHASVVSQGRRPGSSAASSAFPPGALRPIAAAIHPDTPIPEY